MTSTTPARAIVVKKEEKEAMARGFIKCALDARVATVADRAEFLLVTRSTDSPIARALASLGADLAAAGLTLRVVVTRPLDTKLAAASALPLAEGAARLLDDVRFQEGHEQLVLDTRTVWIGDCMRRDPDRHDAFEFHTRDCETTARWATTSFERMWSIATPLSIAGASDLAGDHLEVADPSKLPAQSEGGPTALTRH